MQAMDNDETIIIAALGATMIVTYINDLATKKPLTIKPLIATFVTGTLLLGVGMWSVEVAKMFAILILITSLAINGKPLFDTIGKVTAK